jgi:hypothetical protein
MVVEYRLEQCTEHWSVIPPCGNHTKSLLLPAVDVVADEVEQTMRFLPCYPSAFFAILLGLQQQPFRLTNVVPSIELAFELSKSPVKQVSWHRRVANRILTLLLQPVVNERIVVGI